MTVSELIHLLWKVENKGKEVRVQYPHYFGSRTAPSGRH